MNVGIRLGKRGSGAVWSIQIAKDSACQPGTMINHSRIELDDGRACVQFFSHIGRGCDTADADDRQRPTGLPMNVGD